MIAGSAAPCIYFEGVNAGEMEGQSLLPNWFSPDMMDVLWFINDFPEFTEHI
jgi:hypothetical protein